MAFDPLNLLLLAVALVVFWRLRSVLGTRTGNERPPFDPLGTSRTGDADAVLAEKDKKVVRFPQPETADPGPADRTAEPTVPVWMGHAEPGSDLARDMERLAAADPTFMPKSFIEGARFAYELIVEAFARGDKAALRDLLSREVFDGFAKAIDQRQSAGETMEFRFVGIDKATIKAVRLDGSRANVTVEFVSEMISAVMSKTGEVIDGDPAQIREITDVWTFERDVNSRNPNWKLVATAAPG